MKALEGHYFVLLLAFCSSFLHGARGSSSCPHITDVVVIPSTIYVGLSYVEIRCEHNGNLNFESFYTPSGDTLTSTVNGKYEIFSYNSYSHIFILNIGTDDIGTYQCNFHQASNPNLQCNREIVLSLDISFCTANLTTYHHYLGETATLECCVENQDNQYWRKKGSTETITDGGNIEIDGTSMRILSVSLEDEGDYECVTTGTGPNILSASLKVYERLSISLEPQQKVVNVSETARLTCIASAYPLPTIVWTREGSTLETETGVIQKQEEELNSTTIRSELIFHNVTNEVTGTYRCTGVANATRSVVSSLQLFGTPSAPEKVTLTIINQISINVTWKPPSDDGNLPLLQYQIMWFEKGSQDGSHNGGQQRVNGSTTNYIITNLLPVTNYTVVLYAVNERGKGMGSADKTITTLPYVPGVLSRLAIHMITVSSVQLDFTLPSHTGGSPITNLLVSSSDGGGVREIVPLPDARPAETRPYQLNNLRGDTSYTLAVSVGNIFGFGPEKLAYFKTGNSAIPNSVRVIGEVKSQSLTLSWMVEDTKTPSTEYLVRIYKEGEEEEELRVVSGADVKVDGNEHTTTISELESETCYTFTVAIKNDGRVGTLSPRSNTTCTLSCQQSPCNSALGVRDGESDVPSNAQLIPILVVTVVVAMVVVLVVVLVIVLSRRYRRKSAEGNTNFNHNHGFTSTSSSSQFSNIALDRSLSSASSSLPYHTQNSSNSDEAPPTGSTIVSENPFNFGTSQLQNGLAQYQNKPGHQYENGADAMFGFQSESNQQNGNGTLTMGSHTLFPIPEHRVPMTGHFNQSASAIPIRAHHQENEDTVLMDNPAFEKSLSSNLTSHCEEREPHLQAPPIPPYPRSSNTTITSHPPPPPIPPHSSVSPPSLTQSQSAVLHVHTPHLTRTSNSTPALPPPSRSLSTNSVPFLGESYSQTSPSKFVIGGDGFPDEDEEDVEFTENDAYESATPELSRREVPTAAPPVPPHVTSSSSATLPPSGPSYSNLSVSSHSRGQSASPVLPRRGSTQSGGSGGSCSEGGGGSQPRFEISRHQERGRGGRGLVFETVTIKSQV